jgi:hypothetical protein
MPAPTYTRNEILNQNTSDFPNNNAGLITPAILRDYNANVANSVLFLNETGSHAVSASYAVTASYALNASVTTGSLLTTASAVSNVITFTKGDNTTFDVTVATGAINTGSFMITGSVSSNVLTFTKGDNTTFNLTVNTGSAVNTGSLLTTASISNATITFTKGDNTTFSQTVNNVVNASTASLALSIPSNLNITASNLLVNNNLTVNGTASFNNVITVTGSAVVIGDQFLVLNANPPFARYAGVLVYDTGSATTASLEWDGDNDNWIIVEETGLSAGILTGPTGSKGSEVFPTNNTILKGSGHHTVSNSNITDSGTLVKINSNTQVTGSLGVTGSLTMNGLSPLKVSHINANDVQGVEILTNTNTTVATFGAGGGTGATFAGQINAIAFSGSGALVSGVISSSYALTASYALNAGVSIDTGSFATTGSNVFIGDQVVNGLILGRSGGDLVTNTAFGSASLAANTSATDNVAVGYKALEASNDSGASNNVAVGSEALKVSTQGFQNVAVGFQAGAGITSGGQNTFVGLEAGKGITGGNNNIAIGKTTLQGGGSIDSNTAVGGQSLQSNTGNENTALGAYAGQSKANGDRNTLLGTGAAINLTSGNRNVVVGDYSAENITSGDGNTIIGSYVTASNGATTSNTLIIGVGGDYSVPQPATNIIEGSVASGLQVRTGLSVTGSFISINGMRGAVDGAPDATIWAVSEQYPDYGFFFDEGAGNDFYEFRSAGTPTVQIDPDNGRVIASQFTGSLSGTASFADSSTSASFSSTSSYINPLSQQVVITGSVRGSVSSLSISSNTASLDCSTNNFYTLTLVSGSDTLINPTNVNYGQTINLLISPTGSGTVSFPTTVKQISGSAYVATTGTGTLGKDILTFITFNDGNLYLANVKNLI